MPVSHVGHQVPGRTSPGLLDFHHALPVALPGLALLLALGMVLPFTDVHVVEFLTGRA